jgi:hypothetical protein
MYILLVIAVIALVIFAVKRRFSGYREDRLLMFAMKESHLYLYLYNQNKNSSPEDIYIKVLGLDSNEGEDSITIGEQTLKLLRENYSTTNQETTYRDIVKFCIMRKIYETPDLQILFSDIVRTNLETLLYCAFLPQDRKVEVRKELDKMNLSPDEQQVFVYCLGTIEQAVNTSIPENY